jgi:hypothetical protein
MQRKIHFLVRFLLAAIFILYALAKFSGQQFMHLTISKPVNELAPIELVWYFFGYSKSYGLFIAAAQFTAGLLLLFQKTYRLGLPIYFGIAMNIAVLDWCFSFPVPATLLAISLALTSALLLWLERRRYAVLLSQNEDISLSGNMV